MVIRYTLSNCQTSTGTRHPAPTSLANPPDIAARLDWLPPPRRSDSDPVNSRMNQICAFPLAVSETHDRCSQTLPGSAAPRGGYSYPPSRGKTTPFITSFSFSLLSSTLPLYVLRRYEFVFVPLKVPKTLRILRSGSPRTAEVDPIRSMTGIPEGGRLSGRDPFNLFIL